MDIGIDLGTTFSVIAVKGQPQLAEGFMGMYLPECDVTILPTPQGDFLIPSVVWIDPADPKNVLVGNEAKEKAKEGVCPIMFSKRSIGTDTPLKLHDKTYTARQVAAMMLKYFKTCAEQALGQPVERAVVTHPAYFDPNQVTDTREAARDAGFDMALPEQMMMEPAAAAMAYLQGDARDPVRVLTFDLGGGTFDVTVLERREGVINMRAFDGDHLLGGYNFDRALVEWILERLKKAGRVIPYDENNPEHRGRRARLLHLAESIKVKLSEQRGDGIPVAINAQDILVDDQGRRVPIVDRITRKEYTQIIQEHLDKTIECSRRALAKAGMAVEEIHEILLVGGSTYGPWVQSAVQQAFGRAPRLYDPDQCVAAGAAILASQLPPVLTSRGMQLVLDVPTSSPLPQANVAGKVRAGAGHDLPAATCRALKLQLDIKGSAPRAGKLNDDGTFIFPDVPLLATGPTKFTLRVSDAANAEQLRKDFAITFSEDGGGGGGTLSVSLPKSLFLRTATGMTLIAEEGRPLPAKCEARLTRQFTEPTLEVQVFQEDQRIGSIIVENIPPEAGEGCPVVVALEITPKGEMKGKAQVLQRRSGAVAAESPVRITFPPLPIPDLAVLRARFDELEDRRQQLLVLSSDGEHKLQLGGPGARMHRKITKLFSEMQPDCQELDREIRQFDRLVNPPADDMVPPNASFQRRVEECLNMLVALGTDPQVQPMRTSLSRIEADGKDAHDNKNHKKWATANENLARLHDKLSKVGQKGIPIGPPPELPPAPILKDHYHQQVDATRSALRLKREEMMHSPNYEQRYKDRCDKIAAALDVMDAEIDKVPDSMESRQAMAKLQIALVTLPRINERLGRLEEDTKLA